MGAVGSLQQRRGRQTLGHPIAEEKFISWLRSSVSGICEVNADAGSRLYEHYLLLTQWNRVLNLTGIRDPRLIVVRHFAESLFLASKLPEGPLSVIDVGSGAGFPGVPLAAVRAECSVTLAESDHRKAAFLRESTRGWANVRVHFGPASEAPPEYDWAISRAVAERTMLDVAGRCARFIGVLAGAQWGRSSSEVVDWLERIKLPWGRDRWLLLGAVRRGLRSAPVESRKLRP